MKRKAHQSFQGRLARRAIAFAAGTVMVLTLLEVSLRILGACYAKASVSDRRQGGDFRILCVGDSVTFGLGAPRDQSYPAQLERLLNRTYTNRQFVVINRGRPGMNSWELRQALSQQIAETAPDVVMLLAGGANLWNFKGHGDSRVHSGPRMRWGEILQKSSVYQLIALVVRESRNTPPLHAVEKVDQTVLLPDRPWADPYNATNAIREKEEQQCLLLFNQGCQRMWTKDYTEAVICFEQAISEYPSLPDGYIGLGWTYYHQGAFDNAIRWFKQGVARDDPNDGNCYDGIVQSFLATERYPDAIDFFRAEAHRSQQAVDLLRAFNLRKNGLLSDGYMDEWLTRDLKSILETCRREDVQLVVQTYPSAVSPNHQLRSLALRNGLPIADHCRCFMSFLESQEMDPNELFVPDGHPNAKGYGLMAMTACETLDQMLRR